MTVFLFISSVEEVIMLSAFLPPEINGVKVRGMLKVFIHPGEDFHGYTYEELRAMGAGKHELVFPHPTVEQTAQSA